MSLVMWKEWLGISSFDCRYRSKNVAIDNRIKQELLHDPRKRAILIEHNQLDKQLFQYACELRYPQQQRQFGPSLTAAVEAFEASLENARPYTWTGMVGRCKRNLIFRPLLKRLNEGKKNSASAQSSAAFSRAPR